MWIRRELYASAALAAVLSPAASAQELRLPQVDVDYDKDADFGSFATYAWKEPADSAKDPRVHSSVVWYVDAGLRKKGLRREARLEGRLGLHVDRHAPARRRGPFRRRAAPLALPASEGPARAPAWPPCRMLESGGSMHRRYPPEGGAVPAGTTLSAAAARDGRTQVPNQVLPAGRSFDRPVPDYVKAAAVRVFRVTPPDPVAFEGGSGAVPCDQEVGSGHVGRPSTRRVYVVPPSCSIIA
jgi:hypothetical protein